MAFAQIVFGALLVAAQAGNLTGNVTKVAVVNSTMPAPFVPAADDVEKAKAKGAAQAEQIAAKVTEKTQEPVKVEKSDDPADNFPTDWMKPQNVMKYDIDADPMKQRIESSEADADAARKFNLQHVSMMQKKRTANEFLYIDEQ
eukprot:gnl/MRDRNA2_/MRDRNA2_73233_c0_seq1.p1 gnl/MRDRNA2_/MRDRNA2_73233_c0~~gnl/MRDRNA2_/MRDRNA2_73233_c0_seq1.p1  ORF type:complete len:144 (+),score=57.30 gnl/MRDRNA2_/MRDRNA2_73233_c0_seq1:79-510(+)